MFELVSRKIKQVTPDLAAQFLAANSYAGQRPMRKKQIKAITAAVETKRFLTGSIAVAHQGWNGGDLMLANGQHQCTVVVETGLPINAVIEEYNCKTPEDFADLYRQFDNNAGRSLAEIAIPEAAALKLNWRKNFITALLSAVSFLENQNGMHKNERVTFIRKYLKEGNFIKDIISAATDSDTKHLRRSPVIAAMIVTFKKCAADAEVFWEQVRDGDNLPASSPALRLRNYLLSTSISFGRGVNAESLNASASVKEMYAKCLVAWNAYRSGGTTQLKYFPGKEIKVL